MVQQVSHVFGRWPRLLTSLAEIVPCVIALTLAGALYETASHAAVARRGACQGALLAWPRRGSGAALMARATGLLGVAGVAGCFGAANTAGASQDARWRETRVWAVRTDLEAWRFLPPVPGLQLAAGRYPQKPDEALVGYELARALGLRPGSTVWVHGRPFAVAGIWQPAGLAAGNLVQLAYPAAALLFPAAEADLSPVYLVLEPGTNAEEALAALPGELRDAAVLAPTAVWADELRLCQVLRLAVAILTLLTGLVAAPAAIAAARPLPAGRLQSGAVAACVGGLGGAFGLVFGWGAAQALNVAALRDYALTPLAVTLRLGALALGWPAVAAGLGGCVAGPGPAGGLGRLCRGAAAIGTVALAIAMALFAGGLEESLAVALARTRVGNAGRLGLTGEARALSDAVVGEAAYLPGCRGVVVEASGGALAEAEDGWPGRPPSGVVYGLVSADGGPGVEVPYPVRLAEGRPLEALDETIVGHELARIHGLELGSILSIRGRGFRVVGIRERFAYDTVSPVNYRADIPLEALRHLLGEPELSGRATLLVPPVEEASQRATYLEFASRLLAGLRITGPEDEFAEVAAGFPGGRTLTGENPAARAQGLYLRLFVACTALALLATGAAVSNALDPLWWEQQEEIAVRRLIGAGAGQILATSLWRALAMAGLGVVLGACGAWALANAVNGLAHGSEAWPPLVITPRLLAATGALAVLAAALFALRPGLQAAAVDPARVLGDDA